MKVSIIVPCYNAEKTLGKCVKSIQEQIFTDWELLLIDDGSSDKTQEFCRSYAKLDTRIRYFRQNNRGVSSARNVGLDNAKGDFVTFVDADDFVDPYYVDELLEASSTDLILCGFIMGGRKITPLSKYMWNLKDDSAIIQEIIEDDYLLYTPWAKLFKLSIINSNGLRFDTKLRLGEDTLFCYRYLIHCKSICVLPSASYNYVGEWGGGKKYRLSYDEVLYLDKSEIDALRDINNIFGCKVSLTYRGWHGMVIKNRYAEYTDTAIWELYCKTHDPISLGVFMQDEKISCLFEAIVELELLYKEKKFKEAMLLMAHLRSFFTIPFKIIESYTPKMKFLLWNIRNGLFIVNHFCLIILFLMKRRCH